MIALIFRYWPNKTASTWLDGPLDHFTTTKQLGTVAATVAATVVLIFHISYFS